MCAQTKMTQTTKLYMLEMSNISITLNRPCAFLKLPTNLRTRKPEPLSKSLSSNLTNSDVFLTLFYIQFSNTLLNMLLNSYTAMLIFMLKCIFLVSLLELSFSFSNFSHSYITKPLPHNLMIFYI